MKTPAERVDALMSDLPEPRRARRLLDGNPNLVLAIKYTLEKRAAGGLPMGLKKFYEQHLREEFQGPSWTAVLRYCSDVLKIDTRTGENL